MTEQRGQAWALTRPTTKRRAVGLVVCNFNREKFSIYRNLGNNVFSDEAGPTGIGMATHMYSGWE